MKKLLSIVAICSSIFAVAQPANDLCSGAAAISPSNGCVSGTTVGAADNWVGSVGCQGGGTHNDVWYTFTATDGTLDYTVTTSGTWTGDAEFVLAEATGACTGLSIAGSDCGPSVLTGTISGLQPGSLYYITISNGNGETEGTFDLCINNYSPPVVAGQDCSSAAILCNDTPFSQTESTAGFGTQEINQANSCFGSGGERQSKWFKFTIGCDGTLEFNINPVTSGDDYDWALYNITNDGCPTTASATPSEVACNWSGCKGSTGISTCSPVEDFEPGTVTSGSGCFGGPAAWESTVINAVAGETYALLVDNFSASNDGFSLTFGGACGGGTAILGPTSDFSFTNPSCGVYDFTKTCQTTNSTFLWTFGDGSTSTAQNPSHTYTTTGDYTVVLEVTDALGCVSTFSADISVDFPVASASPNPDEICSGETTNIILSSTVAGTSYSWIADDNPNVTGEDLVAQNSATIANTLVNTSGSPEVVTYTVTPTAAGCVGADLTVTVTVNPPPTITGNAPICIGSTVQLNGSGTPDATTPWTSSNTGVATVDNTGLVTGVSAGTSTITYTDDIGCQNTIVVTVNPDPTISGNAPICVGFTVQLSGSGTPDATTPWASSNTGVATVDNTGLVTGVSGGTSTITYTNSNGCQQTVVVTVNPLPTISGNAPVCIGSTLQLTGSGTPDGTTPWTSSVTGVATIDNTGLVTGVAAGTSTITYTDANGCQNTVVVTVNPDPTISGNSPICIGETLQLTGSGTPDATTPWTSSNTGVATVDNTGLVTGVSAGTSTITYTDDAGCQNTVVVTIDPLPTISGNAPVCAGETLQLTGSGTPDATTPWTSSNTGVATIGSTGLVTGLAAGTTTITYLDANGCENTVTVSVTAPPVINTTQTPLTGCDSDDGIIEVTGGGATGTVNWTGTESGTSGIVTLPYDITGLAAGTYNVTFTDDVTGCTSDISQETFANPGAPVINPINNYTSCDVDFTLLNSDITGTALSGSQAYYTETGGTGGTGTLIPDGTVYSAPTNITIYAYDENGICSTEESFVIVINELPTISGNAPICAGSTVQLSGSGTPDGSSPWTSSNSGVATVNNTGLVTGVSGGSSTITYTDANGCQNTVSVTVNPTPTISGNVPVCVSSTVQLTGSGTPNGTTPWISSNTSVATVDNTGLVTGIASGTSTITYTDVNGCQSTEVVTVNANPTISGNTPICIGATNQLSGSGVPDPTTPWLSSNTGVAIVDNTGLVTGVSSGTTTITYTDANGCQNSEVVTVNPDPTISGTTDVCAGLTTQLTGSGTPNATTPWESANTSVATVDNTGLVTGLVQGTVTITYTNDNGCQTSVVVTVNETPVITGNSLICGTSSLQLSGSGTPDGTTPWTSSNTGVANVDNTGLVTGVSGGTTTITYTNAAGCQVSEVIQVNDLPTISGNTAVCLGDQLQLTGSGTPDATTPWESANPGIATIDNTGLVTTVASGTVTITYTDVNGCQNTQVVDVIAPPTINPIADQVVCDSLVLPNITGSNLSAGVSYWDATGGTGTQYSAGDAIFTSTTMFIYDTNGSCPSEESFTITVNNTPVLNLIADTIVCGSYTLETILGTNLSGNEGYYDDSQANGGVLITGDITTTQTVWVFDSNGSCNDEASFLVTVNEAPTGTISGGGDYCEGDVVEDVIVDVTGTPDWTINYTLDGLPFTATGSTSPIVLGNTEGTYDLVDITDNICTTNITGTATIQINPIPLAPTAGTDMEYCSTEPFDPMTASGNGGTFNWYDDPSLISSLGTGSTFEPLKNDGVTIYYVTETIDGCEGPSSTVEITIIDCKIIVPTAFTPNDDDAHDVWELIDLDKAYPNSVVRIFNRWGNILFESSPGAYNGNEWDGTYNGDLLPVGSYYYVIELNNEDEDPLTGTVTIILQD